MFTRCILCQRKSIAIGLFGEMCIKHIPIVFKFYLKNKKFWKKIEQPTREGLKGKVYDK